MATINSPVLKFPFEFQPLRPKEIEVTKKNFNVSFEFARVGPKGYIMSADYEEDAEFIYNLPLNANDVIVDTFPRSGTTWTQELVWLIVNNLDYETAGSIPLTERYFFLEFSSIFNGKAVDNILELNKSKGIQVDAENIRQHSIPASKILPNLSSPRFIKTHLPLSFLPPTTLDTVKVVYIARDPRDAVVSFYHLNVMFTYLAFTGDFKIFWDLFRNDCTLWTPFFEHLKEAWALRHHPNMLFLFYEDLSKDLPSTVRRVADHFNKQYSEEQLQRLCDHLDIKNFKNNKSVNGSEFEDMNIMTTEKSFIRKGKVGGWRDYFDEEMSQQAERWIAHNLRDTDLRFPHLHHH